MTGRRLCVILLVPYAVWLILAYRYHFLDGVNLAFHEAGHLFLSWGGQTLHFLGGTIGQLFFPIACAVHFARRGQLFEACICVFWLGESVLYVAEYLGDAKDMALPLVGGHIHDWNWLLRRAGLLDSCRQIAFLVHGVGSLLIVGALVAAWQLSDSDEGRDAADETARFLTRNPDLADAAERVRGAR